MRNGEVETMVGAKAIRTKIAAKTINKIFSQRRRFLGAMGSGVFSFVGIIRLPGNRPVRRSRQYQDT